MGGKTERGWGEGKHRGREMGGKIAWLYTLQVIEKLLYLLLNL
jgi:hypothetical protein